MKSYFFIRLAVVAAAMTLATAAMSHDPSIDRLISQPDGLHKAAVASGGTYRMGGLSPPKYRFDNLNALVAASPTIVVASASNVTAELRDQGRFITTNYQLNIIQTIKGDLAKTDFLEMPGGTYTFSDGSVAKQIEPVSKALRAGTTYILFLKRWEDQPNHFRVVGAGQGIFEVALDSQRLISYTYIPSDSLIDDASAGKAAFLEKVQTIVAAAGDR